MQTRRPLVIKIGFAEVFWILDQGMIYSPIRICEVHYMWTHSQRTQNSLYHDLVGLMQITLYTRNIVKRVASRFGKSAHSQ